MKDPDRKTGAKRYQPARDSKAEAPT